LLTAALLCISSRSILYDSIVSLWSDYWKSVNQHALREFKDEKSSSRKKETAMKFRDGEQLHGLAQQLGIAPCTLARDLLHDRGYTRGSDQLKSIMRRPASILVLPVPTATTAIGVILSTIPLEQWREAIQQCINHDTQDSPFVQAIKSQTGSEYESLLESHLTAHGIPFQSEEAQRLTAKAVKTPDALLSTPIMVHGHVVNWIDSKAQFADPTIKKDHLDKQLRAYVNRLGPGMVIFWLDFVEGEDNSCTRPISKDRLKHTASLGLGASSSVVGPASASAAVPSSSPSRIDFAAPAFNDDQTILLLTDFPSEFTTMDQLLGKELQISTPPSKPAVEVASTTTAPSPATDKVAPESAPTVVAAAKTAASVAAPASSPPSITTDSSLPPPSDSDYDSTLVQYIVMRGDLVKKLKNWNTGGLISNGSHACCAVNAANADDPDTRAYLSTTAVKQMHTVTLQAKDVDELRATSETLKANNIKHHLWLEQPDNIETCLATKPYPRGVIKQHLAGLKLFR
jgi:hypothetical protein